MDKFHYIPFNCFWPAGIRRKWRCQMLARRRCFFSSRRRGKRTFLNQASEKNKNIVFFLREEEGLTTKYLRKQYNNIGKKRHVHITYYTCNIIDKHPSLWHQYLRSNTRFFQSVENSFVSSRFGKGFIVKTLNFCSFTNTVIRKFYTRRLYKELGIFSPNKRTKDSGLPI